MKGRNAMEENTKGGNQEVQLVQQENVICAGEIRIRMGK